ncbi:MAG: NAD(P)/FAD-dependent oxidoreductase [Alphaproteobacteria bacterium]|nr:NAD(P)/FAD-dependent oxidoreductase [Alphaproteobacteria bacterium]
MTVHTTDVVVIGAGPVGLFSVFECGMLGLKCHVFDALDRVGGQCAALYPEKPIYDIPAHPHVTGAELVENLHQQALSFQPVFHLGEQVSDIACLDADGKKWRVSGTKGTEVEAEAIIIAAGVGAFGPNRPPLAGIEDFEKESVHYCVNSRESYRGKHIVIAGGGDSAVDWALSLQEIAASVSVVHRRPKFRAAPDSESKLKQLSAAGKIDLVVPYQLSALSGQNGRLESVVVESLNGEKRSLRADVLLPFFGLSMDLGPITNWGLETSDGNIAINQATAETNRPGIYAIGDIATYPHKLKLILVGFAEAAQAAHAIRHFLRPEETVHFEYSTTKGMPIGV